MPINCEEVLEIAATIFVKGARDGCIEGVQALIDGFYNYNPTEYNITERRIFEIVASNLNTYQFIALRQLIVRVADRALYNWFRLLQSTDEIQLRIIPEGTDAPVDLKTCEPHLPYCVFGFSGIGWIAKYSHFLYPYKWAEDTMSLWDYKKAPIPPMRLPDLPEFPDPSVEWHGRTAQEQEAMDKFGYWLVQVVRDRTMDEWLNVMAGNPASDVWLEMQVRSMPDAWAELLQPARQLEEDVVVTLSLRVIDCFLHSVLYDLDARSDCAVAVKTCEGWVEDIGRVPMLVNLAAELFGDDGWIARFSRYPRASVDRNAG